jgi:hypothetical protein
VSTSPHSGISGTTPKHPYQCSPSTTVCLTGSSCTDLSQITYGQIVLDADDTDVTAIADQLKHFTDVNDVSVALENTGNICTSTGQSIVISYSHYKESGDFKWEIRAESAGGQDTLTLNSKKEIQQVMCKGTDGSYTLSWEGKSTTISATETSTSALARLIHNAFYEESQPENDNNILITVEFDSNSTTPCSEDGANMKITFDSKEDYKSLPIVTTSYNDLVFNAVFENQTLFCQAESGNIKFFFKGEPIDIPNDAAPSALKTALQALNSVTEVTV